MAEIELSKGMTSLVDDSDLDVLLSAGNWYAGWSGSKWYAPRALSVIQGKRSSGCTHS